MNVITCIVLELHDKCPNCIVQYGFLDCWIQQWKHGIEGMTTLQIKDKLIVLSTIQSHYSIACLALAIKHYYPQHRSMLEKILLLI